MIITGKDRLKKTIWLRSQACAIGTGSDIGTKQLQADRQELWFSDFARCSEFDRAIRDVALQQQC